MDISSFLGDNISNFIHTVFLSFIALFPVINPIGTAFVINPFFEGVDRKERVQYVRRITFMVFYLCIIIIFSGHWILQLFGISVPVVRLAGGIVIFMIGWRMLSSNNSEEEVDSNNAQSKPQDHISTLLLYPITFPMTAGAGAISVLLTLSSHSTDKGIGDYLLNTAAIVVALILICILIFVLFSNTNKIIERLGEQNKVVVNKIFAFLIMCVAIEIASTGIIELFKL